MSMHQNGKQTVSMSENLSGKVGASVLSLCPPSKKRWYIALQMLVVGNVLQMTPIEFGVSRSKVTVTFKLRGAYMFYKHLTYYGHISILNYKGLTY